MRRLIVVGNEIVIPKISDYEVRRELLRIGSTKGLLKLESLLTVGGSRFLPIDTHAMRLAANLWADARRSGQPTAAPDALDADVILAAQAIGETGFGQVTVATANVNHISRYVSAAHWRDIDP
jgi:predicted nucleic acid-binding protein